MAESTDNPQPQFEEAVDQPADAGESQSGAKAATISPEAELAEMRDRLLRTQAELENYRKRARRELEDERRYALMPLMRDLLPVMDNIQRAIDAAGQKADVASLLEGFKMVGQQLETTLTKHHCLKIAAQGEPFDPHRHDALMQQPSEEHPENTVVAVAQAGYALHDRVVRPAQVIVSKKP